MKEFKEFQEKKVWAVVGSVHNRAKYANKIYKFLKSKGYIVYAVDPTGEMVDSDKSYKSFSELPDKPEAVDMVINPALGEKYLDEANTLGIKYVWFQPGAESVELIKKANSYGMNVVYNECVMVEF